VLEAELQGFIRGAIKSTWALELLLLVQRQPERAFSVDELVLELRGTPQLTRTCIGQLENAGLVACGEDGCRYAPASPAIEHLSQQLAQAYLERPVAVISTIVGSPNDRLRNFSDAFRFTKKDE
jgi:hypothetical protein